MFLDCIKKITELFGNTDKMPVLFIGHGSPMNAIEENEFGVGFRKIGYEIQNRMPFYVSQRLGKPEAHM